MGSVCWVASHDSEPVVVAVPSGKSVTAPDQVLPVLVTPSAVFQSALPAYRQLSAAPVAPGGPVTSIGNTPVERAELFGVVNAAEPTPNVKVAVAPTLPALSVGVTDSVCAPFFGSHETLPLPFPSAVLTGCATPSKVIAKDSVSAAPFNVNELVEGASVRHWLLVNADEDRVTVGLVVSTVNVELDEYFLESSMPSFGFRLNGVGVSVG